MRGRCLVIALVAIVCSSSAKTPDQLKADLASIMPTGKKARLVWVQGGTWKQPGSKDLYVVDSDDGAIRKLNTTAIDAENPHLTADGSRVIYGDGLSGRIYIVNWNGSTPTVVTNSGRCLEYWQEPGSTSDWVVAGSGNGSPFTRINVDTKAQVTLWNGSSACGSPIVGISNDGTHLSAYFEQSAGGWDPGVIAVPGGPPVYSVKKGGCGMGMAPDNSYDYFVHWSRLGNGHHGIQFYNGTAARDTFTLDDGILAWAHANNNANENTCHDNDEFQNAKMTNDRNFVTFPMFNTKANPFIVRLSDRKWISIDDQLGCTYAAGLDVLFYAPGTSTSHGLAPSSRMRTSESNAVSEAYSINGRRLARFALRGTTASSTGFRGVVVRRSPGNRDRAAIYAP